MQTVTKHSQESRLLQRRKGFSYLEQNGVFDAKTREAVHTFQQRYQEDILDPWSLTRSTGQVYYTTQKKINERYCSDRTAFPLSDTQKREIAMYKNSNTSTLSKNTGTTTPEQTSKTISIRESDQPAPIRRAMNEEELIDTRMQTDGNAGFLENAFSWLKRALPFSLSIQ